MSYLKAKLVEIVPTVIYDGKVVEQYATLEIAPKKKIAVYDLYRCLNTSMVGEERNFKIDIGCLALKKNSKKKFGFIPPSKDEKAAPYTGYTFYGKIKEIIDYQGPGSDPPKELNWLVVIRSGVLDIGCGEVLFYLDKENRKKVKVGDFIEVKGRRIDLYEVK